MQDPADLEHGREEIRSGRERAFIEWFLDLEDEEGQKTGETVVKLASAAKPECDVTVSSKRAAI